MALSVLSSSSAVTARRAMSSSASSSSAPRRAASRMVEQWSLKKTLKEKSLGDISTNISEGVRFGGFTAPNERFVARMSMLGMAAAVVGEVVTGQGTLGQIGIETGTPLIDIEDFLFGQTAIFFALALAGFQTGGQFVNDPKSLAFMKPGSWRDAFGLNPEGTPLFGFTENNELFIGRLAAMGFLGTTIVEAVTGAGPLHQIGLELGASVNFEEDLLGATTLFFLWSAVFPSIIPAKLGGPDAVVEEKKSAKKAAPAKKTTKFSLF